MPSPNLEGQVAGHMVRCWVASRAWSAAAIVMQYFWSKITVMEGVVNAQWKERRVETGPYV